MSLPTSTILWLHDLSLSFSISEAVFCKELIYQGHERVKAGRLSPPISITLRSCPETCSSAPHLLLSHWHHIFLCSDVFIEINILKFRGFHLLESLEVGEMLLEKVVIFKPVWKMLIFSSLYYNCIWMDFHCSGSVIGKSAYIVSLPHPFSHTVTQQYK